MFFILALGRSGTRFFAGLLSQDRRGVVHQEPYLYDLKLLMLRQTGLFDETVGPMLEERFSQLLPKEGEVEFYGEVNSYLRYEVDWLRRRFDPTLIHLVRDGRDFVRSAYIRLVYTPREFGGPIIPKDGDPYASRWAEMTRFQRLCWYWMHTNEYLATKLDNVVRFEDVLADYDAFSEKILRPTGVRVSRETWQREVARPRNSSRTYRTRQRIKGWLRGRDWQAETPALPRWQEWDDELTGQFWDICGDTMRRFGYDAGGGRGASFSNR